MKHGLPYVMIRGILPLLALLALGCEDSGALERVSFTLRAGGAERAAGPLRLTTRTGWSVTLTTARVALGPIYLNNAPPLDCPTATLRGVLRWLGAGVIGCARADETQDHLEGGRVVGQVLRRVVVDALSPALSAPLPGDGVSESASSAEIGLLPMGSAGDLGPAVDPSAEVVALVAGVAEKDGQTVPFRAGLPLDAAMADGQPVPTLRKVRRSYADVPLAQGGSVELRVDPRALVDLADFADLATAPLVNGEHVAGPTHDLMRALLASVRRATPCPATPAGSTLPVYRFRWAPPEQQSPGVQ